MVNLIVQRLKENNSELIPAGAISIDAVRQARISAEYKRDVLNLVWRETSPATLLSIGQRVRDAGNDPIWHAAMRSSDPSTLFDKWRRFEVFAHSRNRVRIDRIDEKRASFHRYTVDGGTPSTPENLLICGLIIALLEEIGCYGLRCETHLEDGSVHCFREDGQFRVPDNAKLLTAAGWTIEWQAFCARREKTIAEGGLPEIALPRSCGASLRTLIEAVALLLMLDIARQWKIGAVAREAGLSTRSLQRKLSEAGLSFSQLVRLVRIHEACRLLKDSDTSMTAIGFCAGFADSSHFSRDFRASMGMTPSDYRTACNGKE